MRLDARTFEFPVLEPGKKGRKRLVGIRMPTFEQMLKDDFQVWEKSAINWYKGNIKIMETLTGKCLWYGYGIRPVPITWILIRDPDGTNPPSVLFSTNMDSAGVEIAELFVERWQIEVVFEEARRHLGMETQRQWADKAIDRITPCILASYSIVNLLALEFINTEHDHIPIQTTSWYKKKHITFSDVLAYVRGKLLREKYFMGFDKNPDLGIKEIEEFIYHMAAA